MNDSHLNSIFSKIDEKKSEFIDQLREFVAIPSVSATPSLRPEVVRAVNYVKCQLEELGGRVELCDLGEQELADGSHIELPALLLGYMPSVPDPKKKTVGIYGHIDVQPAQKADGWKTEPFELTLIDDKMYGRGASDDKGPVLGWINCLKAFRECNTPLPINLKFVFEAMEESGSYGLAEYLRTRSDFFKDIDYLCICDTGWLGTQKPCLTYGLRGICYFFVEVTGASRDQHSGDGGGVVFEAMADLVSLLNSLVDTQCKILIPGIEDSVMPLNQKELDSYSDVEFDLEEQVKESGTPKYVHATKEHNLQHIWRYPSLSIHGIEGAFAHFGAKTVIPGRVTGKFSIRLVPHMDANDVVKKVESHLYSHHERRGSPNKLVVKCTHAASAWYCDPQSDNFQCGRRATQRVYGVDPELTRCGGSIPIVITMQEMLGDKSILLLPMGEGNDGAHSQNEKLAVRNYISGIKLFAAYLYEISKLN